MPERRRWEMLALVCVAELLAMSLWFAASALAEPLGRGWGLTATATGWLTGAVQLGFVIGTAALAIGNVADLVAARWLLPTATLVAAGANAALLVAPNAATALLLRLLTGVAFAGIYPPAMKMMATWFRDRRGLAIGAVVGALTVGKATPYLLGAARGLGTAAILLACSAAATAGAVAIAVAYRDGPYPFERRPFSWRLAGTLVAHRETRLAIGGYLGHMWELYAMWTWVPVFVAASLAARGEADPSTAGAIAFGAIAAGGLGCLWGGWQADRTGRERLVNLAMAVSGVCSIGIGALYGAPPWALAAATWTWGFFVVADSAQFSTLVTEVTPRHAVGTALTLQTCVGS